MALPPISDDAIKKLVERLVKIESPSGDGKAIARVVEALAEELDGLGTLTITETTEGPWLELSRGQGGALLLGHADTVWPKGTLKEMPWRDEGDWVYGPGTLDMKGGLAIGVAALRSLSPTVPFRFLVTPDEEIGSAKSRDIIEDRARQARMVIVLEAGMPGGGMKISRAGVGDFTLAIRGIESHAGLEPDKGASAIREMSHQVLWLAGLENKVMGTTLNVGVARGGTRSNVVPGRAEAFLDVRVTSRSEMDRIIATFKAPPRFDVRCRVEYTGDFNRPPMEPNSESQSWAQRARNIWESLTGEELVGARVGGASDGNYTAGLSPTLDGLGPVGQGAHARHEGVEWRFMEPRVRLIGELIAQAGRY